jgi:hypothetical protein
MFCRSIAGNYQAMFAIIAFILFAFSWLFHGFGFNPNNWIDWQSFMILGLAALAVHLTPWVAARFPGRRAP